MKDGKPKFRCGRCDRAIRTHPHALDGAYYHPACALAQARDLDQIEALEVRAQAERAWREFTILSNATD